MELFLLLGLGGAALLSLLSSSSDNDTEDTDDTEEVAEDELVLAQAGDNIITGDGDDVILSPNVLDGPVTVQSGDGNDIINIDHEGRERSEVNAGAGDDIIRYDGDAALSGGDGNDTIESMGTWNRLSGGDGDDLLTSHETENSIYGGEGNDTIEVETLRFGHYYGGEGDDTFELGFDYEFRYDIDDTISGGAGDDVFNITNRSIRVEDTVTFPADEEPHAYEFNVAGDEGADTFEVTHELDIRASSSTDDDFYATNSTIIRDFDPDEDTLIVTPNELGVYNGTPTMTVESSGPYSYNGMYDSVVQLEYTQEDTGSTATWRLHVMSTRALTGDDVVLNLAAA